MLKDLKKNNLLKKKMGKYKIKVLRDLCIGAASCVAIAPKTFQLDNEAKAIVIDQNGDTDENIMAAAQSCPVNAIILEDENGNQVWPK